jgi:50S ribosomal protein L16 3-hydroxylase
MKTDMAPPGLAALIHPLPVPDFLAEYWPGEPLVVHGLKDSVKALTGIPFLESLDVLLKSWPSPVQAHLPEVADEASSIDASPQDARKLFENKMGLLFNDAQRYSPVLSQWLAALHRDLGLPAMTHGRCMMYATPKGKGTAPHFDQNVNFVLQLHGTKKWWIAPNEHVENPMQRHTLGQPLDPELEPYTVTPLPARMPVPNQEILLEPGSLLFVPRGYWHSTLGESDALSLNFTYNQPTWIDLLTVALKSRLSLSSDWRELADGVSSADADRREIAELKFDALLAELVEDLPNWNASDILGATEG